MSNLAQIIQKTLSHCEVNSENGRLSLEGTWLKGPRSELYSPPPPPLSTEDLGGQFKSVCEIHFSCSLPFELCCYIRASISNLLKRVPILLKAAEKWGLHLVFPTACSRAGGTFPFYEKSTTSLVLDQGTIMTPWLTCLWLPKFPCLQGYYIYFLAQLLSLCNVTYNN